MLFSQGQGGGGAEPGVVDNAQSNRILLILTGVLVLLIFMDFQARRHYDTIAASSGGDAATAARERLGEAAESISRLPGEVVERGRQYQEPARVRAEELLHSASGEVLESELLEDMQVEAVRRAESAGDTARERIGEALDQDALDAGQLKELVRSRNTSESQPAATAVRVKAPDFVYLYFIRFRNGKSELVRVRRPIAGFAPQNSQLALQKVIAQLKAGPSPRETGLINAFDRRVDVNTLRFDETNGVLTLDVNSAIGRLGRHVVQDRLDQMTFTLTQFPEVRGVRLLVDGQPVQSVGSQNVPVASVLRPSDRIFHNFE